MKRDISAKCVQNKIEIIFGDWEYLYISNEYIKSQDLSFDLIFH